MWNEYLKSIWLILPITLITMLLEAVRLMGGSKTGHSSMFGVLFGYLVFGLGFGWLAIFVFRWMAGRWPLTAQQFYFWLALGLAVVLTLLAVGMHLFSKSSWLDVIVWTGMNFLWALGYGWFLPRVLISISM